MPKRRIQSGRNVDFSIAKHTQAPLPASAGAPAPSYEGTPAEHARRIIEVVVNDNPVGRKAA